MKKIILLLIVAFGLQQVQAQKTVFDENASLRTVTGFRAIKVSGGIDLYLSQGNEAVAVSASSPENRDRIKTEVENGVLKIFYDWHNGKNNWGSGKKMKVYVSFKTLEALGASGGSDIIVDGTINTGDLSIDVSGGSDFKGKLDVRNLTVDQSGGSDVDVSGTAASLKLKASGGSDFNGYDFSVETGNISGSGGSDLKITVNKELSVHLSGACELSYKGNGMIKEIETSGASKVSRKS